MINIGVHVPKRTCNRTTKNDLGCREIWRRLLSSAGYDLLARRVLDWCDIIYSKCAEKRQGDCQVPRALHSLWVYYLRYLYEAIRWGKLVAASRSRIYHPQLLVCNAAAITSATIYHLDCVIRQVTFPYEVRNWDKLFSRESTKEDTSKAACVKYSLARTKK